MGNGEKTLMEALWQLNDKVDVLLSDVGTLKTDVAGLKTDVAGLKTDVAGLKTDVEGLKTDMEKVKSDVARLEELEIEVKALHFDVVELRITYENELNTQIRMIAEGHADLLRHFDHALERKHEMEVYAVRVIHLEGEVRRLKQYWDRRKLA